jgi:FkbM family methyltransferase
MAISDLVYDVGMHNGDDTAYYLLLGYRVVAVEADPNLVAGCERRFDDEIRAGRLIILNCAIGPTPGNAKFWLCLDKPEWNSFLRANASRCGYRTEAVDVCVRSFRSVLAEHGVPHYLKIDIEGYDIHCLRDLDKAHLPRYLSLELVQIDELLAVRELGYDRFKLVVQGRHRELPDETRCLSGWINRHIESHAWTSNLARRVSSIQGRVSRGALRVARRLGLASAPAWSFSHESSGPFGEEAPGDWISFEDACLRWLDYVRTYPGDVWCDLHATHANATMSGAAERAA